MYRIIPYVNPILSIWTHSSTALTASHTPMPPLPPSCRVTYVLVSCSWLVFIMVVYIFEQHSLLRALAASSLAVAVVDSIELVRPHVTNERWVIIFRPGFRALLGRYDGTLCYCCSSMKIRGNCCMGAARGSSITSWLTILTSRDIMLNVQVYKSQKPDS